jgi:SAM-dependent methyltransferase
LKESLPGDHSRQVTAEAVLQARVAKGFAPAKVLDFGCGDGRSIDLFRRVLPQTDWTGVDIKASPEVASRRRQDGRFVTYDGYELPFPDRSFPLVYSHQVLEHVRKPQTSQFEPYHSYSLWNFTVYGFKRIVEDAGMQLAELRPGIDGFTLMRRTYEGRPPEMSKYFSQESPINEEIEKAAGDKRTQVRNFRKLLFCGQFAFVVQLR